MSNWCVDKLKVVIRLHGENLLEQNKYDHLQILLMLFVFIYLLVRVVQLLPHLIVYLSYNNKSWTIWNEGLKLQVAVPGERSCAN